MRVAVTGASGMIGSETARQLRAKGHEVLAMDIRPPADPSIPHRIVDLRAPSALRAAFDGVDAVCHIGEIPSVHRRYPAAVLAHNVEVGSSVMQIAVEMQVPRLIYTSTCQVYGCWGAEVGPLVSPLILPLDETAPLRPQNAYALSKTCNETFAQQTVSRHEIAIAAFRFPWVIPASHYDHFIRHSLSEHRPCQKDGFGTYLGQEDAANAYVCALERGWTGFEAFHFVAADVLSDEPVGPGLAKLFPEAPLPPNWPENAAPVTTAKAKRLLGWTPAISLQQKIAAARGELAKTG